MVATFPLYLASYADGDWGCNVVLTNGAITAGSLPNLVAKINEWSHKNIKGSVVPTPLDIGSPALLATMPPFVFFTGHKDFKLTEDEVANLRHYLQNGGAIWGDNSLAGFGSRFDVAFRREMKRVIPDKDKKFEELPLTHPIFRGWFPMEKVPKGMNFYHEPIQHLDSTASWPFSTRQTTTAISSSCGFCPVMRKSWGPIPCLIRRFIPAALSFIAPTSFSVTSRSPPAWRRNTSG